MKYSKILSAVVLFMFIALAGCERQDVSSISGPVSDNSIQSLVKH